jgi:transcription initiation factor TFIID subunit 3
MLMLCPALMKKHSKTGVESRFQGTVLGVPSEPKTIKIEGGGADSIEEWCRKTRERAAKEAESRHGEVRSHAGTREPSEDVAMETV